MNKEKCEKKNCKSTDNIFISTLIVFGFISFVYIIFSIAYYFENKKGRPPTPFRKKKNEKYIYSENE